MANEPNEKFYVRLLFKKVLVKDVMTTRVRKLNLEDPLSKAVEMFSAHSVSHLPVVDDNNKLVGLLSHKYLYKAVSPRKFVEGELDPDPGMVIEKDSYYWKDMVNSYILRKIMFANPPSLKPEDTLSEAVLTMARHHAGCVFIINPSQEVIGSLTSSDVVDYLAPILLVV